MPEGPARVGWRPEDGAAALLDREWLVGNGLGGYATGTVAGVCTRRYHGLLVAALPHVGRTVMLNHLSDSVKLASGRAARLSAEENRIGLGLHAAEHLREFRVELGLPVWTYRVEGVVLERRVVLPYQQNTVHITWRLLDGPEVPLRLRVGIHFRSHDAPLSSPLGRYRLEAEEGRFEIVNDAPHSPRLRLRIHGERAAFTVEEERLAEIFYRVEESRGYDAQGDLFSPGWFRVNLRRDAPVTLVASTEQWEMIDALSPEQAGQAEASRRAALLDRAQLAAHEGPAAELVLAADAFVVEPVGRVSEEASARAEGDRPRTVIAGYPWFTDWGRDAMISLEGLCLRTGRAPEAGAILRAFGRHLRDGLIPNLFPEGEGDGLYHTADATLWMFHALDRYVAASGDRVTLRRLLPRLEDAVAKHLSGTRFGIRVDEDGLLRQGEEGYQLTWMDAKVDGWVVTPRRGKAVEINALWYHALRILEGWLRDERGGDAALRVGEAAERTRAAFNRRFWYEAGGYLYDVVDGEDGDSAALRPNQILAVALPHPVLDASRWRRVVDVLGERLLTPVGLRSLDPADPDYKPSYHGDLRTRDAAYHQGTVWSWLLGPYVDAWLRVHPGDRAGARRLLDGLVAHLGSACIGQISEVFDAEPPFMPRGCVAQAWGVAETLRLLLQLAE